MRTLIIVSEYPPVASGVARSVDRLAQGLRGYGHEVDVLSGADAPYFVSGQVRLSGLGGRLLAGISPLFGAALRRGWLHLA